MAVDVSLYNISSGDTLDMGTQIDFLGKQAHISEEDNLVAQGIISPEARENRRILRNAMRRAGFTPLKTEWWHFNYISRAKAKAHYKPIP
jgi:D-alanyl-D-alanine dipeptidase